MALRVLGVDVRKTQPGSDRFTEGTRVVEGRRERQSQRVTFVFDARSALGILIDATRDGRLDELCSRFEVRVMSAFGSATRAGLGEGPEPKDLDIAVSFQRQSQSASGQERLAVRIALWTALVDLTGYEGIDLVVIDVDNPVLRAEALTGVPLFESISGEYAEAQIAAMGECRDTAHLRRRNLELMAK